MRAIKEQVYYSSNTIGEGYLIFPQDPKSYFETSCSEWEDTSMENKLLDMGILLKDTREGTSYEIIKK